MKVSTMVVAECNILGMELQMEFAKHVSALKGEIVMFSHPKQDEREYTAGFRPKTKARLYRALLRCGEDYLILKLKWPDLELVKKI
jgi:hypothetical protein